MNKTSTVTVLVTVTVFATGFGSLIERYIIADTQIEAIEIISKSRNQTVFILRGDSQEAFDSTVTGIAHGCSTTSSSVAILPTVMNMRN